MARKRVLGNQSYSGLNLKPQEDKILMKIVDKKGVSFKSILRMLVRKWMEEEIKIK